MSDNVASVIYSSQAWSKMWGVAVGIFSPSLSIQKLFPLPVSISDFHFRFRDRHLSFRCRLMTDNVGSAIFGSGVVENVGVAVGIASLTLAV